MRYPASTASCMPRQDPSACSFGIHPAPLWTTITGSTTAVQLLKWDKEKNNAWITEAFVWSTKECKGAIPVYKMELTDTVRLQYSFFICVSLPMESPNSDTLSVHIRNYVFNKSFVSFNRQLLLRHHTCSKLYLYWIISVQITVYHKSLAEQFFLCVHNWHSVSVGVCDRLNDSWC